MAIAAPPIFGSIIKRVFGKSFSSADGAKPKLENYPYNLTYAKTKTAKKT